MYIQYYKDVYAMQPSEVIEGTFNVHYKDPDLGLSVIEQLYTARGSQGTGSIYT